MKICRSYEAVDDMLGEDENRGDRVLVAKYATRMIAYPRTLPSRTPPNIVDFIKGVCKTEGDIEAAFGAACYLTIVDEYDVKSPYHPEKVLWVQQLPNCLSMCVGAFCFDLVRSYDPGERRILDLAELLLVLQDAKQLRRLIEDMGVIQLSAKTVMRRVLSNAVVQDIPESVFMDRSFFWDFRVGLWHLPCPREFIAQVVGGLRVLRATSDIFRLFKQADAVEKYHVFELGGEFGEQGEWIVVHTTWGEIDGDDVERPDNVPYLLAARELVAKVGQRIGALPDVSGEGIGYRTELLRPAERVVVGSEVSPATGATSGGKSVVELPLFALPSGVRCVKAGSPELSSAGCALDGPVSG
jgi:hypothetical protein